MTTRGSNAQPAEHWVGAAAASVFMFNHPGNDVEAGIKAMQELYANMPDAIAEMGNDFLAQLGLPSLIP